MSDSPSLPAHSPQDHPPSDQAAPGPARGEFLRSGSLTPPVPGSADTPDLGGVPAEPMPGFHLRAKVQALLRSWRNGASLCAHVLGSPSPGSREHMERFILPQHTMHIK